MTGDQATPPARLLVRALSRHRLDILIASVLVVPSVILRRLFLPRDGVGGDDGWLIAGAKGELDDIYNAGLSHPGFTGLIKGWLRFVSDSAETTTIPLLVVSLVTPAVVYLGLRWAKLSRSAACIAAAVMVVAPAHIIFTGRVKPYVIETLVVFILGLLVLHLARTHWSWRTVGWWVLFTTLAATVSTFILLSSAVAMLVLTGWSRVDRTKRISALVAQGGIQLAHLLVTRTNYDAERLADWWANPPSDGRVEFFLNPIEMTKEIGTHLHHLGAAATQGGSVPAVAVVVVSVLTLAKWSSQRVQSPMAQYFGLLLVVAFVGGLLGQIPFGAREEVAGTRVSIWLIPSLVVGLAMFVETTIDLAARIRPRLRLPLVGFWLAIGIVVIVAGSGIRPTDATSDFTNVGTRSSSALVAELTGPNDTVIVSPFLWFSYAAEPGVSVEIESDETQLSGFFPFPAEDRIWVQVKDDVWDGSVSQMEARVAASERVVLHAVAPIAASGGLTPFFDALEALDFVEIRREIFGPVIVIAFERVEDGTG